MNKLLQRLFGLFAIITYIHADPVTEFGKIAQQFIPGTSAPEQKKIFTSNVESKQAMLATYQAEKSRLEQESKNNAPTIATNLEETLNKIRVTEEALKKDPENEFLNHKKTFLNEKYYYGKEYQQLIEQERSLIDQIIKQLTVYLSDPSNKRFTEQFLEKKKTFEELQVVYQKIIEEEKLLESLADQEKNAISELDNRKRASVAANMLYQKQKEEYENIRKTSQLGEQSENDELWQLQEKLFIDKQHVDTLKFKEIELKLELIRLKMFIAREQRDSLRAIFRDMTAGVRVSDADVANVKEELEKKKQKFYTDIRSYDNAIELLNNELKMHKQELEVLAKRYNMTLDADLDKWNKETKQLVSSYVGLCEVGFENDIVLTLSRQKDYFKSLGDQENEKIKQAEILLTIKETFHRIHFAKFSATELDQKLKNYDMIKAGMRAHISLYNERKNMAAELLEVQKRALEKITYLRENIFSNKDTLFREHRREYNHCLDLLTNAETSIKGTKGQIELINKTIAVYTDIVTLLNSTNKQIDFIVSELSSTTIWHRPQYAVSLEGLMHIVPDVEVFISDLVNYFSQIKPAIILTYFKNSLKNPLSLFISFIMMLGMVLILLLTKIFLPGGLHYIQVAGQTKKYAYTFCMFLVALGRFFLFYFNGIALWLMFYGSFKLQIFSNPYLYSIFYLASIPYFLYLAHQFINYIAEFNSEHGYLFLSKEFEFRFTLIFSALIYITIILSFFKEAFMLGNYLRSELPRVLVAINSIVIQVALIELIPRDQIVNLIPVHDFWGWVHGQVNKYYHLILLLIITIIVMSNPYVGFGRLVFYVIRRILFTIILVALLVWVHRLIKRFCAYFFFVEEDEISRERFYYAKSLYGFSIILLFLLFIFFGAIMVAKIWSWPEQLAKISHMHDILGWLKHPFTNVDQKPVSMWTVLSLIFFVFGGIGFSFILNNFVMSKIFDILLIETGIQNTISSITYYLCFILSVIIGFNAVGLNSLLYWLIALVVGIGWVIKDPVSDFVSYFIILVQRPIKVGDLIKLEHEKIPGVVRRITPRSVLLRCRNSTTVIIPNSTVINKNITNWNYTRDFTAFDDILITISYTSDAILAQKIFLSVLSENPYVLKNPKPVVRLDDFDENGYVFMIRGFLSSNYTLDQWDIASEIRLSIIRNLKEAGIGIAIPIRKLIASDKQVIDNK